ncbi:MAG TPA: HAD family phosphatase [Gemmatimonadales bacterium]|nr:HAD family phosphatase [Gemmatimonadales bacterium]
MLARGILFDFNGVIANDEALHFEALSATLAAHGISLAREEYYGNFLGLDDRECFRRSFEAAGRRPEPFLLHHAVEQKADIYEDIARARLTLVPGVRGFIEAASSARMALGVASSALLREVEFVLQMTDLREHFETLVSAEQVERCKPDPQTFERARQRMRLSREECVVIEDSLPGIEAAKAGGFRCVAIASSLPAGALANADLVWHDFDGHHPADLPWADA